MPKKISHTEAFAHFGTKARNVQWSWSARSEDGKTVVGTLWQDQFERKDGRLVYSRPGLDSVEANGNLGFKEWKENLIWAQDHCEGRIHVIVAIAKDPKAHPRSIKECFPSAMVMRLKELDRETGAFVGEIERP